VADLVAVVTKALERVTDLLEFELKRALNVCMYHSLEVMRRSLDRKVPATMLMAPYHAKNESLIVCASPAVDAMNGDAGRMLRQISHEITHCAVAEISHSCKELGDGNVGRRVPAWLDEGLAVMVANEVGRRSPQPQAQGVPFATEWTEDEANRALDDLNSPRRSEAFAWAVSRVRDLCADGGMAALFTSLARRA
jgi:hypothetical protein